VLAEEIRNLSSLARIFIYTGRATDQLRTTAARLNVEGVLQKPPRSQVFFGHHRSRVGGRSIAKRGFGKFAHTNCD
jgi:hypothetical protein